MTEFEDADHAAAAVRDENGAFALGVFDVMLPGSKDGVDLCRTLREEGHLFPVIFLTAKNRIEDKIRAFDSGGDDYLTKPFELEELLARVKARMKRPAATLREVRIGAHVVDLDSATAREIATGKIERFNERETAILQLLLAHRGRPVTRDKILDHVWGESDFPTNRTIDNYIVKFRRIFEEDQRNPRIFITRHGTGYELANED